MTFLPKNFYLFEMKLDSFLRLCRIYDKILEQGSVYSLFLHGIFDKVTLVFTLFSGLNFIKIPSGKEVIFLN